MSDDLISRQAAEMALIEKGQNSRRYKWGEIWELNGLEIREVLDNLPSVQPKEKTGKWKQVLARRDDDGYILRDYKCTNCFGIILGVPDDYENLPRYCCMCGAKMEGD